jgi:hypothetical protein
LIAFVFRGSGIHPRIKSEGRLRLKMLYQAPRAGDKTRWLGLMTSGMD